MSAIKATADQNVKPWPSPTVTAFQRVTADHKSAATRAASKMRCQLGGCEPTFPTRAIPIIGASFAPIAVVRAARLIATALAPKAAVVESGSE